MEERKVGGPFAQRDDAKRANRQSLLKGAAIVASSLALCTGAYAQSAPAPAGEVGEDVIVVTGSRLAARGFDAPTPLTVIGEQEYILSGTQNAESLLLDTPQFAANQLEGPKANTVQAGAPIGTSTLNLRNFGATRNLVLVNGRRFAISGPAMTTDINTIPAALISRTEVVTGGSSAVYGSDAITGVVNFVMKDDFEGVEIALQNTWNEPTGTPTYGLDLTVGGNFDSGRGNVTASIGYLNRGGFTTSERGGFAVPSRSDGCVTADSWSENNPGTPLAVPLGQTCTGVGGRLGCCWRLPR
jgi:outer membrane cobalamin receptor